MNYPEKQWCLRPILNGTTTTPVGWAWIMWEMNESGDGVTMRFLPADGNKKPIDISTAREGRPFEH